MRRTYSTIDEPIALMGKIYHKNTLLKSRPYIVLCLPISIDDCSYVYNKLSKIANLSLDPNAPLYIGHLAIAAINGEALLIILNSKADLLNPSFIHFKNISNISGNDKKCEIKINSEHKEQNYEFSCKNKAEYNKWLYCIKQALQITNGEIGRKLRFCNFLFNKEDNEDKNFTRITKDGVNDNSSYSMGSEIEFESEIGSEELFNKINPPSRIPIYKSEIINDSFNNNYHYCEKYLESFSKEDNSKIEQESNKEKEFKSLKSFRSSKLSLKKENSNDNVKDDTQLSKIQKKSNQSYIPINISKKPSYYRYPNSNSNNNINTSVNKLSSLDKNENDDILFESKILTQNDSDLSKIKTLTSPTNDLSILTPSNYNNMNTLSSSGNKINVVHPVINNNINVISPDLNTALNTPLNATLNPALNPLNPLLNSVTNTNNNTDATSSAITPVNNNNIKNNNTNGNIITNTTATTNSNNVFSAKQPSLAFANNIQPITTNAKLINNFNDLTTSPVQITNSPTQINTSPVQIPVISNFQYPVSPVAYSLPNSQVLFNGNKNGNNNLTMNAAVNPNNIINTNTTNNNSNSSNNNNNNNNNNKININNNVNNATNSNTPLFEDINQTENLNSKRFSEPAPSNFTKIPIIYTPVSPASPSNIVSPLDILNKQNLIFTNATSPQLNIPNQTQFYKQASNPMTFKNMSDLDISQQNYNNNNSSNSNNNLVNAIMSAPDLNQAHFLPVESTSPIISVASSPRPHTFTKENSDISTSSSVKFNRQYEQENKSKSLPRPAKKSEKKKFQSLPRYNSYKVTITRFKSIFKHKVK